MLISWDDVDRTEVAGWHPVKRSSRSDCGFPLSLLSPSTAKARRGGLFARPSIRARPAVHCGAHRLLILLTALGQVPLDPRLASFVASGALVLAIGVLMGSAL
jgi:hypothetical protein